MGRTAVTRFRHGIPPSGPLSPLKWCITFTVCGFVVACGTEGGNVAGGGDDLAGRCEQALETAPAQPVRSAPFQLVASGYIGDEESAPLGKIVGAVWHPRTRRLFVLDAFNGSVTAFDSAGGRVARFGRIGGGPGEFEELGGGHGARPVYNQLTRVDADRLAVMELGRVHIFTADGRFVQRIRVTDSDPGPFAVLHVAGFSDGSVLFSETGAMRLGSNDRNERTALRLRRAALRGGDIDTVAFGAIRNNLNRLPPFTGLPPSDPYLEYYRRTWDALPAGLLAVPSQRLHGVCFYDGDGRLTSVHRVGAPLIRVDAAERERVLSGFRAIAGNVPPMGTGTWESQYPAWPETVPPYGDLALGPDSVAWLLRPLPRGEATADLVHATRGYLGSLALPSGRLPLTFDGRCGYVIEERASGTRPDFYGLVRWCPRSK